MEDRQAYEQKVQAQIAAWQAEMDRLQAEAMRAGAEAKVVLEEQLVKLQARQAEAEAELAKLQTAGEEAWQDLRDGMEESMSIWGEAVKSAMTRFMK